MRGFIIFVLAFLLSAPGLAFDELGNKRVAGTLDATVAGLGAAELSFDLNVRDGRYDLTSTSRSRGLLGLFFEYRSTVTSTGRIEDGQVKPELYQLDGYSGGEDRQIRLHYDSEGQVADLFLQPTPEEEGRQLVPDEAVRETVDPATLFMKLMNPVYIEQAVSCSYNKKLYDGYRMSLVNLRPIDGEEVRAGLSEAKELFDLSTARGCYFEGKLLYGRTKKEEERAKNRDETPATIWFAKPKDMDVMVPIVLNKRTRFGTAIVRLVDIAILPLEVEQAAQFRVSP